MMHSNGNTTITKPLWINHNLVRQYTSDPTESQSEKTDGIFSSSTILRAMGPKTALLLRSWNGVGLSRQRLVVVRQTQEPVSKDVAEVETFGSGRCVCEVEWPAGVF
jgi:hypothetical protein